MTWTDNTQNQRSKCPQIYNISWTLSMIKEIQVKTMRGHFLPVRIRKGSNSDYSQFVVKSFSRVQHFATHGLQHARLPCPSLSPGVCSKSCPLSQWCHPTILSSVILFSSCPQFFQQQCLFQRVGSLNQVAKVLELQLQQYWWVYSDFPTLFV